MATINVISAPNASDADAATYTLNVVPYGNITQGLSQSVVFSDGIVKVTGLPNDLVSFYYGQSDAAGGKTVLEFSGPESTAYETLFSDQSPDQGTHLEASRLGDTVYITEGTLHLPAGATPIQGYAVPPTPPPTPTAPQNVAAHDTTTNTDLPDITTQYAGPVAGIAGQYINVTPDNLSLTALKDSLFIKTGAGNDAITLHGGTNVVDAGTGSNFLTSGGGFDTFFLDARNIPAASSAAGPVPGAVWDTVQGFGHNDAVTLWGIGPGTALNWQKNEGAAGHTGLTLHAITPNGATTSLTLAGIDNASHLALSYGQSGGASYLYVKAV